MCLGWEVKDLSAIGELAEDQKAPEDRDFTDD